MSLRYTIIKLISVTTTTVSFAPMFPDIPSPMDSEKTSQHKGVDQNEMVSVGGFALVLGALGTIVSSEPGLTADGLPFTIHQANFQADTFELYGRKYVDTYGFTDPSLLPLDNTGYSEILEKCDFDADSVPFYEYSNLATVVYSPSTTAYDKYHGIDLIPENRENYQPGGFFTANLNFKDHAKYAMEPIKMQRCRIPQDDGGAWHVQRVGPFVSRGGYDWWSVAWPDLCMLSEAVEKFPNGIDVIKEMFVPVLKDGSRLSYPPIHTHHIHALTRPGVRPRLNERPMCLNKLGLGIPALDNLVRERNCYNLTMFFEQHGDHICQPKDDGIDCLMQGDKNPRRLVEGLDVEGELNDVRPFNSEPLEWYYQVAMRWKPADHSTPVVSQQVISGPGRIVPPSQLTKSFTAPTPTHAQSVMIYSATLTAGGDLVRCKLHSHSGIWESTMLLFGEFGDFGLADDKFVPHRAWQPLITTELGFEDNDALAHYILYHLGKSQQAYDAQCIEKEGRKNNLRNPICKRPRPEWVCGGAVDSATVTFEGQDYIFDRRPKTWCKPHTFAAGDRIVAVGFNKKVTQPPSPVFPGKVPAFMLQHISFILSFVEKGRGHSSYDLLMAGHDGTFFNFHHKLTPPGMLARMVSILLYEGPMVNVGNVALLEWVFTLLFTALALWVVYGMVWAARKVPAIDNALRSGAEVLLALCTTYKPLWNAPVGDRPGHKYEMIGLVEAQGDADLDEE